MVFLGFNEDHDLRIHTEKIIIFLGKLMIMI